MQNNSGRSYPLTFAAFLALSSAPAFAQDVRIIGKDGSIDLTGTLVSAENGELTLRTEIGQVTVKQSAVDCEGAACPQPVRLDYAFSLAAPGDIAEVLVPILFDGFATDKDAEAILLDETGFPISEEDFALALRGGARLPLQILGYDGSELGNVGIREASEETAFQLLASGDVSMLFSQIELTQQAVSDVAQAGAGNLESFEQEHVIAVDGLAVIAHPQNPIANIGVDEAAAVLAGRITNWAQLGGPNAPVNVYSVPPASEDFRDADAMLLQPFEGQLAPSATVVRSTRELVAAVTDDPNGFGVVSYHSKRGTRAIPLVNECGMVVNASPFTIKTEEYPLEKRIVAYNRNDVRGLAREFLNQLDTPELDGLVSKAGFIDLSVITEGEDYGADRLAALQAAPVAADSARLASSMISEMERASRLSTTFRFAPGSSALDNRALRDLQRVVDHVAEAEPSIVYVVGFADSAGPFGDNQRLSEQRARRVAELLLQTASDAELDGVRLEVRGYSELAPVACNETFRGRAINRRVEIWVE